MNKTIGNINTTNLTERESEVLNLLILGYTNNEIADCLNITIHTVKAHISSILYKLVARSRTHLVYVAIKSGIVNIFDIAENFIGNNKNIFATKIFKQI